MGLRVDYPYDEAINDLRIFFSIHISDDQIKFEFDKLLDDAFKLKNLPMRHISHKFFEYRKMTESYAPFSDVERKMMDDLMHFWA